MDYEKKYKALVEAVKTLKETNPSDEGIQNWVNDNVPELKESESEEEMIKKAIIDRITSSEPLSIDLQTAISWIEKQGEQKPTEEYRITGIGSKHAEGKLGEMIKNLKPVNEVLEQNPTDKFEPKFREGDYIVYNDNGCIYQIKSIKEDAYRLRTLDGDVEGNLKITDINNKFHLWTTQDAKDGDVLCSNQIIILFKQWEDSADCNFVIAYAGIDVSGKLQITDGHWLINNNSHPATKEQRELLFLKIKEAGYEWDVKKREFNKIEEKFIEPDDLIEESYQQQADDLINMVTEKPAWSEEDKRHIELLISICEEEQEIYQTDSLPYINIGEAINWLKSLKDKYTWSQLTLGCIPHYTNSNRNFFIDEEKYDKIM